MRRFLLTLIAAGALLAGCGGPGASGAPGASGGGGSQALPVGTVGASPSFNLPSGASPSL